jgi:16S rRNA (guanine527-N7)-methyltransferase
MRSCGTSVFHVKHEGSDREAPLSAKSARDLDLPSDVDPGQTEKLLAFESLLISRAVPMGMIARGDGDRLWERHIADSLRASPEIPDDAESVCDMGSGAGLPGIPLAIVRPDIGFVLAEVRRNRASFLADAVSELELDNVSIHPRRLETFRQTVDVCLARAFATADVAWSSAEGLLTPAGRLIYWAGTRFRPEADLPGGVRSTVRSDPALARSGPLVIMARQ